MRRNNEFRYVVVIECETKEQSEQVISERINHDEDYGFDYRVWIRPERDYSTGPIGGGIHWDDSEVAKFGVLPNDKGEVND